MRNLLLLCCILALPCISSAQSNQSSWGNLSALRPGQKIDVVEMNLKKDTGTFAAVSDDAIRINESTGEQTIPRASVMRVTLRQNKHRVRNTLIGAAMGAGAGAGIAAASYKTAKPCPPGAGIGCVSGNLISKGAVTGIGAALGFVGGAAVGAVLPSHPTIYRAELLPNSLVVADQAVPRDNFSHFSSRSQCYLNQRGSHRLSAPEF